MFRSEKMEKLTCVVIDSKIDRVVEEIVKAGVLHLIDIKEIEITPIIAFFQNRSSDVIIEFP